MQRLYSIVSWTQTCSWSSGSFWSGNTSDHCPKKQACCCQFEPDSAEASPMHADAHPEGSSDSQLVHQAICVADMWKLHAMVWQQQPSKAVVKQLQGTGSGTRPVCPAAQQAVLQVLNSPVCQAAPPSTQYIARLVKQLISAAEEQHQELSEPLLELNTALLMLGSAAAAMQDEASWRYKTFYYSSNPSWQELQQLQLQHCKHLAAAVPSTISQPGSCADTNSHNTGPSGAETGENIRAGVPQDEWTVSVQLQQRLRQRQQAVEQLLSAVHLQQQPADYSLAQLGPSAAAEGRVLAAANGTAVHAQQQQHGSSDTQASTCDDTLAISSPIQDGHCAGHVSNQSSGSASSSCGLITVHSSDNMFEGGTGCHLWDAGFLLAEFVLNNQHLFKGKHVLEIGCGPGLVATCLCRSQASRVLLTDGDPQTLVNCLSNLSMNGHRGGCLLGSCREATDFVQGQHRDTGRTCETQHQVLACPLDWHEDVPGLSADVIVGSDICYDPEAVPSLVRLLQQLLTVPVRPTASQAYRCEAAHGPATPGSMQMTCVPTRQRGGATTAAQSAVIGAACVGGAVPHGGNCAGCSTGSTAIMPVAYIATTKRQGSTLQLFLDECAAAGLTVEEIPKDPLAWGLKGSGHGVCSCGDSQGDSFECQQCRAVGVVGEGANSDQSPVVFQQLPALQEGDGRERYVLHKVMCKQGT